MNDTEKKNWQNLNLDVCEIDTMLIMRHEDFDLGFVASDQNDDDEQGEGDSGVKTVSRTKVKRPSRYKVLIHNDDYTTMEFVVWVLKRFFGKTQNQANGIMLKVHNEGVGVCGIYTYEVAETKVAQVSKAAKDEGHPLLCTMEKE